MTNLSTKFSFNATTIIAIVAGGTITLILIIVIVVLVKRRKKSQRPQSVFFEDEDMGQVVFGPLAEYRAFERQSMQSQSQSQKIQHQHSQSQGQSQSQSQSRGVQHQRSQSQGLDQKIQHQKSQSQIPADFRISIQQVQPIIPRQSLATPRSSAENMTVNLPQRARLTYIPYVAPLPARVSSHTDYSPIRNSESSETGVARQEGNSKVVGIFTRDPRNGGSRTIYPGNDWK